MLPNASCLTLKIHLTGIGVTPAGSSSNVHVLFLAEMSFPRPLQASTELRLGLAVLLHRSEALRWCLPVLRKLCRSAVVSCALCEGSVVALAALSALTAPAALTLEFRDL